MPRGVYDRTKTKEQRAAEKAKGAAKAAPAKKAQPVKAAPKATPTKTAAAHKAPTKHGPRTGAAQSTNQTSGSSFDTGTQFSIVRENISTLVSAISGLAGGTTHIPAVHNPTEIIGHLDTELEANIQVLGRLRRQVFGLSEAEQAQEAKEAEAQTVEEVEQAPVAAPVAAAPQPTPAPAQPYPTPVQGTVPMPPAPTGFPSAQ